MTNMEPKTKKRVAAVLLFGVVAGLVLLGVIKGLGPSKSMGKRPLTIAQAGDFFLYAPLYVAIDGGFFERQGLDVSLTTTGGDDKTWAAVISGSASFGVSDPTFVAISDSRGVPGRVVASIVNGVPFWGVSMRDDISPFRSANEIGPHTVATFPSPSTAFALQSKMFKDAGFQPRIREGAFGTLAAMLRSGQADIALELEPNVSQLVKEGATVVYSMPEIYGDFAITGLTTTPDFITRNPEVVQSVADALHEALQFIRSDPKVALEILSKRFPEIDSGVAEMALERAVSDGIVPRDLRISQDAWDKAIQLRAASGDIQTIKPMSLYVTNSFALKAIEATATRTRDSVVGD